MCVCTRIAEHDVNKGALRREDETGRQTRSVSKCVCICISRVGEQEEGESERIPEIKLCTRRVYE